jgi:crossover junction endodeoxyribonuclease RuvC
MGEKLELIFSELTHVIRGYEPTAMAIEEIFFAHNVRSALLLGQARGVAILAAVQAGLPVYEYAALQVKQAVAGYGRAPKRQIQEALKLLLELPQVPEPEDAADALAVAVCHMASRRLEERLKDAEGAP